MAGGLLNLVGIGNQNVILNGNPQKTFWTSTFKRYTNFGLQNFRLDYEGLRQLSPTADSTFTFKVKRYAELLMDTYFVIQLPDIYSPIFPPKADSDWVPYEFKWVKNLGAAMVRSIRFTIGGSLIQTMSGQDLIALANRDLNGVQKVKWDSMTGNTKDLHDPANAMGRVDQYPNAVYAAGGSEPSIRGRQLRIPIPIWWAMNSQQAFPLVCLQYNELQIEVVLRPVRDLFQIRDVTDATNGYQVVAPNVNIIEHQFSRFLQPPPNPQLEYASLTTSWKESAHLSCTYCFLSDEESKIFALNEHNYLFKELHDSWFYKVAVTDKAWLQNSTGMVASWMVLFQRSDVNLRNEWSNFTNWPYAGLPSNVEALPVLMEDSPVSAEYNFNGFTVPAGALGYGLNPNGTETGLYSTGLPSLDNRKEILVRMGIAFDGSVREEVRGVEMFKYEQQYRASPGYGSALLDGLNCYNFCLDTSPANLQPSGAVNLSKYSKIELDFVTIEPPVDPNANFLVVCDPETGGTIGTVKQAFQLYDYTFNLLVIEERFNVLKFIGGNAALMNAR